MVDKYLKKIADTTAQGDAREESYYSQFSAFLSDFAKNIGLIKIQITTLSKKTEAGNPDFRVWDGKQHIVGYIEAKKPEEKLDIIENSEQLKRYRNTFPNLILTDFYEFRLYRNGQLVDKVSIGRAFIAKKFKTVPPIENKEKFFTLLEKFFAFSLPKVYTSENLAIELANRTKFLRDEIITKELEEEEAGKGKILGIYEAFRKYLVATLTQKEFADIYSQTITYGLFAARTQTENEFSRKAVFYLIPPTIGILRDVFHFISLGDLPLQMEVIIDDIAEVLQAADVNQILQEYYKKGKGEDPIIHFYETFLSIYDPATREKRGVYYTPESVVKYIVSSVHCILKSHFKLKDGLASEEVTLLDPAAGTLTFPAEAIKIASEEYISKYGEGGIRTFIYKNILPNYHAFELMMAAYTIGHFKIGFLLESIGFKMMPNDRFNLYLTNALDVEDLAQTQIPGISSLSEESHLAAQVKNNESILVILGNPPYSGISANINKWTEKLLKTNIDGAQSYYEVDGKSLGERKLWLQDDYVKFLRFSQWKIHKAGHGIVGMITNHSYLDNPTFRGMRQSMMKTFNEIYILDLHGNALKKETTPDGSKDENVFDIQQGVAIALFIKIKNKKGCKIYHTDLFGLRNEKYNWLSHKKFEKKNYELLKPQSPWYFFIKRNTKEIEYYNKWLKVNEIFPVNSTGILTARDRLAVDIDKILLVNKIRMFRNKNLDDETIKKAFDLSENYQWKINNQRELFRKVADWEECYRDILYRPFDLRSIYYQDNIVFRMRKEIMRHMVQQNIGLITCRQIAEKKWQHALISENFVDDCTLSNKTKERSYLFPLYLYKHENQKLKNIFTMMLFEPEVEYDNKEKKPNISEKVINKLFETFIKKPNPEQILSYVYAVLYSNIYREKYAEFLKIDFPRIPFTSDYSLFQQLAKLGDELTKLHLLNHSSLDIPISKYKGKGDDNKIVKPTYSAEEDRVYINPDKYFDNISFAMWNYHFGGYQVMEKYLKDRKGKEIENPIHYCQIATSISKTIEVQNKIDTLFLKAEKKIIIFK